MADDRKFNPKRIRMRLEADPDQTVDLKRLFLSLAGKVTIIRRESKRSKKLLQSSIESLEPKDPIHPFDPTEWHDLSVRNVLCEYTWKGVRFHFTADSHSLKFLPYLDELIFRFIPFRVYDILNEEELHSL